MPSRRPRHDGHRPASRPPEGPGVPADADLGARLERALRDGLGGGHVDVAQLLRDTRQASTRRSRVRRTTMIAVAAIAVGAVPVSLQTARWMSSTPVPPGAGSARVTPSTATPPPSSAPSPEPTPSATAPQTLRVTDDPRKVMYKIPDSAAFTRADLTRPLVEIYDSGQYRKIPTVSGQACSERRFDGSEQPIAGRQWSWAEENTNRLEQLTVDLTVTGWAGERSALRQLAAVSRDTGACRFGEAAKDLQSGGTEWAAVTIRPDGTAQAHTVRMAAAGVLVAVTVSSPKGLDDAIQTARRLADVAVRRADTSGLTTRAAKILQSMGAPGLATDPAAAPTGARARDTANPPAPTLSTP